MLSRLVAVESEFMKKLETVSVTEILNLNKFLKIERHEVQLSNGTIIPDWGWIVSPDYVTICAVDENGLFICFRQAKYAMPGISVGPPGGYIEKNEIPLEAAQRELLEETGYVSENWIPLASCPSDANRGNGMGNFFLAYNCYKCLINNTLSDDVEDAEPLLLSQSELLSELDSGAVIPMPWLLCFTLGIQKIKAISSQLALAPCVVVAGIIRNASGEVLIARRARGQTNAGMWEFPGGKLEVGETEMECLRREIREEFGAEIEIIGHLSSTENSSGPQTIKLTAWNALAKSSVFVPTVHSEIQWVTPPTLSALREKFTPADVPLLSAIQVSEVSRASSDPFFV